MPNDTHPQQVTATCTECSWTQTIGGRDAAVAADLEAEWHRRQSGHDVQKQREVVGSLHEDGDLSD